LPRTGNLFPFFNPATGVDLTKYFPNVPPHQLFSRVGVRDSLNGPNQSLNPYLFEDFVNGPT
jgi:hypothetical protein